MPWASEPRPLPPGAGSYAPQLDAPGSIQQTPQVVYAAAPPTNGMAVASMVLGILGLCSYGVTGVLGLIFGLVALKQIKARNEGGRGLAVAGVVLGSISVAFALLMISLFALVGFL